jgi:putative nucleotidyltransferase with HDIG domain
VIWRQHSVWLSFNCFVAASIAGLIVQNPHVFLSSFAMSLPLLLVSHFVFRSSIGRVEDAQRHVEDLRRLYLSTVETLAIAVDAKDQVTHGHIRRVQRFALRLAMALDVRDESTLRAIEAAGLLHDIGKLAIPDHILNKPGKLTAAEFDRMKLHAEAGAQILSAIDFPFPVVPIVRHHHENWDGGGYPTGLSGDQIPIGARILAVVDCFDALTSDRPYRRALSAESALNVLTERRGTMYDPFVVDTFVQVYRDIANLDVLPAAQPHILVEIARSSRTPSVAETRPDGGSMAREDEAYEPRSYDASDLAERAARALEGFLPVSMVAVYAYAPVRDEVVMVYQKGGAISFAGCRLPLGRTVTGWAAANRTCVVNGDPSLDLGEINATACERMRSCLAVPLTAGDRLLGVLTLYSDQEQAFDASARRVAEGFAPYLARWIERAGTNGHRSSSMPGLDSHSPSEAPARVVTH